MVNAYDESTTFEDNQNNNNNHNNHNNNNNNNNKSISGYKTMDDYYVDDQHKNYRSFLEHQDLNDDDDGKDKESGREEKDQKDIICGKSGEFVEKEETCVPDKEASIKEGNGPTTSNTIKPDEAGGGDKDTVKTRESTETDQGEKTDAVANSANASTNSIDDLSSEQVEQAVTSSNGGGVEEETDIGAVYKNTEKAGDADDGGDEELKISSTGDAILTDDRNSANDEEDEYGGSMETGERADKDDAIIGHQEDAINATSEHENIEGNAVVDNEAVNTTGDDRVPGNDGDQEVDVDDTSSPSSKINADVGDQKEAIVGDDEEVATITKANGILFFVITY